MAAASIQIPAFTSASTAKERFDALGQAAGLDPKIAEYLHKEAPSGLGFETEADFLYAFDGTPAKMAECIVDVIIEAKPARPKQIGRLCRLWQAINSNSIAMQKAKTKAAEPPDMDELLPPATLAALEDRFWNRYKVTYPAEVTPADIVISRCFKELERLILQIKDVTTVKVMAWQTTAKEPRKRKMGTLRW